MKLYRCNWPNGDISIVLARDKLDAAFRLDEFGDARAEYIREIKQFMVDFTLVNGEVLLATQAVFDASNEAERAGIEELGVHPVVDVTFCERTSKDFETLATFEGAVKTAAHQMAQEATRETARKEA